MPSISEFCDAMRWAADSDQVGYSQSDRWGVVFFGDGLYNADCSSLVIQALRYAGFDTGDASYTGNMSENLTARGWERLRPGVALQAGDILLNDGNHVAAWLGDCLAQASIDENGNIAGGRPGDQTGAEINTRSYYNYPWNAVLRCEEEGDMLTKEDANTIWGFDNWGDQQGARSGTAWRNLMDTNRRVQALEKKVATLDSKLDKIVKKLGA